MIAARLPSGIQTCIQLQSCTCFVSCSVCIQGQMCTFRLCQTQNNHENPVCHEGADEDAAGLIPRALKDLFAKTAQLGSPDDRQHCRICMSYVEIYNERLHDLLQPYKPNARLDPQVSLPSPGEIRVCHTLVLHHTAQHLAAVHHFQGTHSLPQQQHYIGRQDMPCIFQPKHAHPKPHIRLPTQTHICSSVTLLQYY